MRELEPMRWTQRKKTKTGKAKRHLKGGVEFAVSVLLFSVFGSPSWARTSDLRINSPSLYRLSYRGTAKETRL